MLRHDSPIATALSALGKEPVQPAEPPALFDPRAPIEVASSGSGSTNDVPPDNRPPVTGAEVEIA